MSEVVPEATPTPAATEPPPVSRREKLAQLMGATPPEPAPAPPEGVEPPAPDLAEPAAVVAPDPAADPDPVLDRSWAALDRRDREQLAREKEYKDKIKALEPLQAAAQAVQSGDRLAAAKALGLDPKAVAAEFWGDDRTDEEKAKAAEVGRLESIEARLAERETQLEQLVNEKRQEKAYGALRGAIAKSKEFEVVQLMSGEMGDAFLADIEAAAIAEKERYGEVPDLADLLKRTEDTLADQYTDSMRKLAQVPKLRQRMLEILGEKNPKGAPPSTPPAKRQPRTITNDMSQEPAISDPRPKNKADRMARARSILEHGAPKGA